MTWYTSDAARAAAEIRTVRAATNASFFKKDDRLIFDEDVTIGGILFGLRVTYPRSFPEKPPRASLRYPELPASVEVHRFTNGVMCLHSEDQWHPRNTGLWIRNRAIAWMHAVIVYSQTGAWPDMRAR